MSDMETVASGLAGVSGASSEVAMFLRVLWVATIGMPDDEIPGEEGDDVRPGELLRLAPDGPDEGAGGAIEGDVAAPPWLRRPVASALREAAFFGAVVNKPSSA